MDLSMVDANKYRDECGVAGQQVARILRGLTFDGTLTTRCWLLMYGPLSPRNTPAFLANSLLSAATGPSQPASSSSSPPQPDCSTATSTA
jgi:hypothetical protein